MAQETVTKFFVEHIQRWLDEEMKRDEQLAAKVQQSGKTAEQACNFVLAEVKKSGRCGFDDAEVYGMVRHFFDEDEIKDPGKQTDIERIVIHEHIELSAKDRQGNRLETVEVNMKTWSIVQSRGLLNDPSERHDEIIELVKQNMNKLKIA